MSCSERRHSFDSIAFEEENRSSAARRRVRFNDEHVSLNKTNRKQFVYPQLTVQEVTAKLKASYEGIENALEILSKLLIELNTTKRMLECQDRACNNTDNLSELERLLSEVRHLQGGFQNIGIRKRQYLEELSRLQNTLHEDRKKMEKWMNISRSSKKKLFTKIDKSSRITKEQQQMINKLKADNTSLWQTLQEIHQHLRDENNEVSRSLNLPDPFEISAQKSLPNTPKCENYRCNSTGYPISDQTSSVEGRPSTASTDCDSTGSSCQEQYLSEKLKLLLERSENVQKLISNVGLNQCVHNSDSGSSSQNYFHHSEPLNRTSTKENYIPETRIPSENERGVRCDMNDIVRRCEELEKKVDECSTNDIRERLVRQLHEIDQETPTACTEIHNYCQGGAKGKHC